MTFFRAKLTELLQYIAVIDNRLASPGNILMKKRRKKKEIFTYEIGVGLYPDGSWRGRPRTLLRLRLPDPHVIL